MGYALAVVTILGVGLVLLAVRGAGLIDLQVYRLGGQTLLDGKNVYAAQTIHHFSFTYPPFAAIAFVPLAWVSFPVGYVVWTSLNAAALVGFVRMHLPRWTASNRRLVMVALAATWLEPVWQTFFLGQIDLVLALAVSVDLLAPAGRRGRGVLTGLAIGIKLTPAIFVPFLILLRHRRAAAYAGGSFFATVVLSMLAAPTDARTYWGHDVLAVGRVGDQTFANDQSVLAVLLRLPHDVDHPWLVHAVWLLMVLVLGTAALIVGRAWWRRGEPRLAVAVVALGGLLVSPVSWTHHWVWCLPVGAGLVTARRRAGLPTVLGVVIATVWTCGFVVAPNLWVPRHGGRELHWTVLQAIAGNTYVWLAVLALALLAYLAFRTPPGEPGSRPRRVTAPGTPGPTGGGRHRGMALRSVQCSARSTGTHDASCCLTRRRFTCRTGRSR